MSNISKGLKKLRKVWRKSVTDVASHIDVEETDINSWESGKTEPNVAQIKKLSTYFKVTLDYLITGKASVSDEMTFNRPLTREEIIEDFKNNLSKKIDSKIYEKYVNDIVDLMEIKKLGRTDKKINVYNILNYNDFDLYDQLLKADLLDEKYLRNFYSELGIVFIRHNITDINYYKNLINKVKNINELLKPFLDGRLPWNVKIIRFLLEKGAMVEKIVGIEGEYSNIIWANDVFVTMLLKEFIDNRQ